MSIMVPLEVLAKTIIINIKFYVLLFDDSII